MATELNKEKQVFRIRNTSLLLDLLCYIIISFILVIIIIIINDCDVSGGCVGGSSSVIF
jgi:hypothetical protein